MINVKQDFKHKCSILLNKQAFKLKKGTQQYGTKGTQITFSFCNANLQEYFRGRPTSYVPALNGNTKRKK